MVLRVQADIQHEMREYNGRLHAEFLEFKQQQHKAMASLSAQMQLLAGTHALQNTHT
jgi:hypothetical protein